MENQIETGHIFFLDMCFFCVNLLFDFFLERMPVFGNSDLIPKMESLIHRKASKMAPLGIRLCPLTQIIKKLRKGTVFLTYWPSFSVAFESFDAIFMHESFRGSSKTPS